MLHVQELVNLKIYLYGQTMGQQRMLYFLCPGVPGHRDTGNINDDRDTQREITDWDTRTQGI